MAKAVDPTSDDQIAEIAIIFPDGDYLQEELHSTKLDNRKLKNQLKGKTAIVAESCKIIEKLSERIKENRAKSPPQDHQTIRILDLERRLRETREEADSYKSKNLHQNHHSQVMPSPNKSSSSSVVVANELRKLQDKLSETNIKLLETQNANVQLTHDLKLADQWLEQETGENFVSLKGVTGSKCNWRGRAQIIKDLEDKCKMLKEKCLKQQLFQKSASPIMIPDKPDLLIKTRNSQMIIDLKKKLDATKARCKVLEIESTNYKSKLSTMTDDAIEFRKIIASLNTQICKQTSLNNAAMAEKEKLIQEARHSYELVNLDLAKMSCIVDNQAMEIGGKCREIEELRQKLRGGGIRPISSYDVHQQPQRIIQMQQQLEAERLKLVELLEVLNGRLADERKLHCKTQKQLRYERQKGAKLEANLARIDLETTMGGDKNNYAGKSMKMPSNRRRDGGLERSVVADDTYKDQQLELAMENVKALQTRLDIEILERNGDLKEFANILRNCTCKFLE